MLVQEFMWGCSAKQVEREVRIGGQLRANARVDGISRNGIIIEIDECARGAADKF